MSYLRSSNNFENLPLTPSQRSLLGLDSIVTKVPGAVPIFKKSTVAVSQGLEAYTEHTKTMTYPGCIKLTFIARFP